MENKIKVLEKIISEKYVSFYLLSKNNSIEEIQDCYNTIETLKSLIIDTKKRLVLPDLSDFNFKELRKNKGFTIEEVRLKTGILDSVISNIENNVIRKPSYANIKFLLDLYLK